MSELGDVLEAMNAAPRGFDVLLGEVANWTDMAVIRRAMEQRSGSGVSAVLSAGVAGPPPPERPITRLWFARDGRFRAEHHWGVNVFDGAELWIQHSNQVTQRSAHRDPLSSLPSALLLRPVSLLALAPFTVVDHGRIAGHASVAIECSPSSEVRPFLSGLSLMAGDRVQVEVDPLTGVLLRVRSWFEGQPAMEMMFEALEYDAPLMHDPFRFDVDANTEVRTESDLRRQMLEHTGIDPTTVDLDDEDAVHDAMRSRTRGPSRGGFPPAAAPRAGPPLAERYMPIGPPPEDVDAARTAVIEVVEHMSDIDDRGGLPNVQGGSNLGDAVQAAGARVGADGEHPAAFVVDDLLFVGADEAVVAFRVVARQVPSGFAQTGRVLKINGRWKIERATMCNLLGMAGVTCPPPPEEP